MKRLFLIASPLIFFCLISLNCSSLRPDQPLIKKGDFPSAIVALDSIIRNNLEQQRIPGAAVAVVHDGRIIFSQCYGYADTQKKVPITEDTYFMVGSLTKSFTALAVQKLIQQGKVDLNADIRKYIPDFSIRNLDGGETPITVNQLLAHTSGLMIDYYGHLTGDKKQSNRASYPAHNPGFTRQKPCADIK